MAKRKYKVVTGRQDVEIVEADTIEENEANHRLKFYLDGDLVGSFIGYSSMSVYTPEDGTVKPPTA